MASAVGQAVGLLAGTICIVNEGKKAIPKDNTVALEFTVGLDTDSGQNHMGGDKPAVFLYDSAAREIGSAAYNSMQKKEWERIPSGAKGKVNVKIREKRQQATYTVLRAGDDAICLAVASITFDDGNTFSWFGDWARACGGDWYYSNIVLAKSGHKPDCMWMDKKGNRKTTGVQLYWPLFQADQDGKVPEDLTIDTICSGSPRFLMRYDKNPHKLIGEEEIRKGLDGGLGPQRPVAPPPRARAHGRSQKAIDTASPSPFMDGVVVVDKWPEHSTRALCESETSWGPDFANEHDGLFCRMSDHSLWPMCSETVSDNCFDNADKGNPGLRINGVRARDQGYNKVLRWGDE